jgi:hypothetical protein
MLALIKRFALAGANPGLDEQDFHTKAVQLRTLGLVSIDYSPTVNGSMGLFWCLTPRGERLMIETRAVRSAKAK